MAATVMKFLFPNSAAIWGGTEKWACMAANALSGRHGVWFAFAENVVGERLSVAKHRILFRSPFDLSTIRHIVRLVRENSIQVLIPTKTTDYVLAGIAARLCGVANILRLGIVRDLRNHPYNNVVYNVLADGIIVNAYPIKETLWRSRFIRTWTAFGSSTTGLIPTG